MTIKEKLISLDINVDKEKNLVEEVKKVLQDNGETANKITCKLTIDGEKIVADFISSNRKKDVKKQVLRPKTIKATQSIDITDKKTVNDSLNVEVQKKDGKINETVNNKTDDEPSWNPNMLKNSNLKISIQGKSLNGSSKNNLPKNGNPLPETTINELKRKKEEQDKKESESKVQIDKKFDQNNINAEQEINNKKNEHNKNISINNKYIKNSNAGEKKDNRNNNFKNFDSQKNNFKNKINNNEKQNSKQNLKQGQKQGSKGKNIKTTFIQNNASIATGTNNRFEGLKRDKAKFNKDYETKNKQQGKNIKNKQDKYKTTISNYENENESLRKKKKTGAGAFIKPIIKEVETIDIKSIVLPETISVKDFAAKLKLQSSVIVKKLFMKGEIVTPNTELSYEKAENIALEYDILCEKEEKIDVIKELLKENEESTENLVKRPPVVCVMGHVDHGKTSILDAIRNTNVIAKEAGGITQHIGAYQISSKGNLITFLDTPGHEAFTAMRLRGAKSTDIAILVVAADDGVKPQTIEAINHAKAANVEIIVAINKIDKPEANVERVKQQLSEYELIPAEWGGQTTFCEVSAKKGLGLDNLLDMILLTADVLDLKSNPNRNARGIVIESLLDKGKGPVARILVQKGTLHQGDYVAMGQSYGKIRAMTDCKGERVKSALPSTPVEILGLSDVPNAGDTFVCFDNEKDARAFAETFISENKKKLVEESKHKVTLDALFDQIKAGELKELNIVLKADVVGSEEAIKNSLEKLSNDEVVVKVIHEGVGNINESDVTLASASNAIVIGFNVKLEQNAKAIVEKENVDVRLYSIIYNAIDDVEKAMKGMLAPVYEEKVIGNLVVRQVFKASSVGNIAGVFVNDGEIRRNSKVRVYRGDDMIFDGNILSLKRFKDEVKDVKSGNECGVVLDGFSDFKIDDRFSVYVLEEKKVE